MRSLSARLLLLTILFVMVAEVFFYVPSIANFRENYLRDKLVSAHLAALALEATPTGIVDDVLEDELLTTAGILSVALRRDDRHILVLGAGNNTPVDVRYDLRNPDTWSLIVDAFSVMFQHKPQVALVRGVPPGARAEFVDVVLSEGPLRKAMLDYSARILGLSIMISLVTAVLVYASLHFFFVRPMRRMTHSMAAFREAPETYRGPAHESTRADEIGVAERELATMQGELRAALLQKSHLASLGTAVTKISHDLRNVLATAQLVSDRLSRIKDPAMQPLLPPLINSIGRAIDLCERTLRFGRADDPLPDLHRQKLAPLIEDVGQTLDLEERGNIVFVADIDPAIEVDADAAQLHRAFLNLVRNAQQALTDGGQILVRAREDDDVICVDITDTGPGLADKALKHLFQPFAASTRTGGAGLGLVIAREILQAHGGDLDLTSTGPGGTTFRIRLPRPDSAAEMQVRASS